MFDLHYLDNDIPVVHRNKYNRLAKFDGPVNDHFSGTTVKHADSDKADAIYLGDPLLGVRSNLISTSINPLDESEVSSTAPFNIEM